MRSLSTSHAIGALNALESRRSAIEQRTRSNVVVPLIDEEFPDEVGSEVEPSNESHRYNLSKISPISCGRRHYTRHSLSSKYTIDSTEDPASLQSPQYLGTDTFAVETAQYFKNVRQKLWKPSSSRLSMQSEKPLGGLLSHKKKVRFACVDARSRSAHSRSRGCGSGRYRRRRSRCRARRRR